MAGVGTIRILIAALVTVAATPAGAGLISRWRPHIEEASARFGVPVEWVERVMHAESGGRTTLGGRPITSHAGAMGLMQLMPGAWADVRSQLGLGFNPHEPRDNILAGTFYLRLMYDRFGYPGLFAAYNAGPRRYAEHLETGRRLPRETRVYLRRVAGHVAPARPVSANPSRSEMRIFFELHKSVRVSGVRPIMPPGLFAPITVTEH